MVKLSIQSKVLIIYTVAVVLISTTFLVVSISRPATTCDVFDLSRLAATADDDVYDPRKLSQGRR